MDIDERKLRLYKYLFTQQRITIDEIPEPYKTEIQATENQG